RGGHGLTRARSPCNDHRPAQPAFAPGCPCPGRSHRTPQLAGDHRQPIRERRRHPPPFIPVTNTIESMIAICRDHAANVKRWRDGQMVLRWVAAGMGEARQQFRRVNGYLHLPALRAALDATTPTVTPTKEDAAA